MATFTNNPRIQLVPIEGYKPDYNFLSQVYHTKQAEYDKGFNMVKNYYNSILNSPVTNSQNDEFRKLAFQKLQTSIKSLSGVDLSQSSNILKGQQLIQPIATDKDLIYDMSVTSYHNKQKDLMESVKNSSDPKIRAQYNDYAAQYIALGEEQLRNANRGDGSVQRVQPRDFVPFEDVTTYLNEQAKEQNLNVVVEEQHGEYIVKYTNGEKADEPFQNWAMSQLSNPRFTKQFEVTGEVKAENAVRSVMDQTGISRSDALKQVAKTIYPQVLENIGLRGALTDSKLVDVENQLAYYEKMYANGFPPDQPNIMATYQDLLKQKYEREDELKNIADESGKVQQYKDQYIAANLHSIYANEEAKTIAKSWGHSKAMATQKTELSPDMVVIHRLDRQQRAAFHADDMSYKYKKLEQDQYQFEQNLKVKQAAALQQKKIAQAKGLLPTEEYIGTYTSKNKIPGVDILTESFNNNRENLFNNAFGAGTGLVNFMLGPKDPYDHSDIYKALSHVKEIGNGKQTRLSDEDKAVLNFISRRGGHAQSFTPPKSAASANSFLTGLATSIYKQASKQLNNYSKTNNTKAISQEQLDNFSNTILNMNELTKEKEQLQQNFKRIEGIIKSDPEKFKGARVIGWTNDSHRIYDTTNLSEEAKNQLDVMVSSDIKSKQRPVGSVYNFSKLTASELSGVFNPNLASAKDEDGDDIDLSTFRNLSIKDLKTMFNDEMDVSYDPVKESVIINAKVAPASNIAKTLKMKGAQNIAIEIPYGSIKASPQLARFNKYLNRNEVDTKGLGIFAHMVNEGVQTTEAPQPMKALGFDYKVSKVKNGSGQQVLNVVIKQYDPTTKSYVTKTQHYPLNGDKDHSTYKLIDQHINEIFQMYRGQRTAYENL